MTGWLLRNASRPLVVLVSLVLLVTSVPIIRLVVHDQDAMALRRVDFEIFGKVQGEWWDEQVTGLFEKITRPPNVVNQLTVVSLPPEQWSGPKRI